MQTIVHPILIVALSRDLHTAGSKKVNPLPTTLTLSDATEELTQASDARDAKRKVRKATLGTEFHKPTVVYAVWRETGQRVAL